MCNKEIVTIEDATKKWVEEFNEVSASLIKRAFKYDINDWLELTPIVAGDNVYYDGNYVEVDRVELEMDFDDLISRDSKVYLKEKVEVTTNLSDGELTAVYINNERFNIMEYDFSKGVFVLDEGKEIAFNEIKKVSYQEDGSEIELDANVLNIERHDSDLEDESDNIEAKLELPIIAVNYYDVDLEHDGWLPMWSTLWTFKNSSDERWVRENLEIVAECGFRIFEDQKESKIYIGIDGAGYNFYDTHWIPLYKRRGLMWHNAE